AGLQVTANELENAINLQKSALNTAISDTDYQRIIVEQTGLSWNEYRSQIEDRILQEKYVAYARADLLQNTEEISEADIQATYEQNAQSFVSPTMSRFSHIFIDLREKSASEKNTARKQIDTYVSRIRNGGTTVFDQIIGETLDDVSVSGGDFGFLISGDTNAQQILGNDFVQEVFALETGDISGVVESNIGLHILQITDRRSPRLLELDNPLLPGQSLTVRQQIQQYIRAQRQQAALIQALDEIVTELRDEADIRIVEGNVSW
ncbi:MAG: peptidylprolyl isomerase, partial [Salinispira sp.]